MKYRPKARKNDRKTNLKIEQPVFNYLQKPTERDCKQKRDDSLDVPKPMHLVFNVFSCPFYQQRLHVRPI